MIGRDFQSHTRICVRSDRAIPLILAIIWLFNREKSAFCWRDPMIGIGFVVVGLVLSGLWIDVVNALIAIGRHIDTQIAQHLKKG